MGLGMMIWPVAPLRSTPSGLLKSARTLDEPVLLSITPDTVATLPSMGNMVPSLSLSLTAGIDLMAASREPLPLPDSARRSFSVSEK